MISFFKGLKEVRDRRVELAHEREEITRLRQEFTRLAETDGLKEGTRPFEDLYSEFRSYWQIPEANVDAILTKAAISSAHKWGVPVPERPFSWSESQNEYWYFNTIHRKHYLTTVGFQAIRHGIAAEKDILHRPWLSWGAIAISIFSLAVAVLKP